MIASFPKSPASYFAVNLGVHILLGVALFGLLLVYVPRAEATMKDYGMMAPYLTLVLLEVSRWLTNYWYVAALAMVPVLALDGVLLFVPRLSERTRSLSTVWSGLCIIALLLMFFLVGIGLWLPYEKLHEAVRQ
jgi:hypothetical protein